jgi:hypothetical protein
MYERRYTNRTYETIKKTAITKTAAIMINMNYKRQYISGAYTKKFVQYIGPNNNLIITLGCTIIPSLASCHGPTYPTVLDQLSLTKDKSTHIYTSLHTFAIFFPNHFHHLQKKPISSSYS